MAYLGQGSLLGSVRLQQHIANRTIKTTPYRFGTYTFPSIITTNEPIDRNPHSFAHRHHPSAINYSDPLTRPPQWRKQVMLPYPPSQGHIERKNYGMSRIHYQNTRRILREQEVEAAAEVRSQTFQQQQEEQRLENEREAEARRLTNLAYAINKINMRTPLTVEDKHVIWEDARRKKKAKLDKQLAGPAGARLEAAIAVYHSPPSNPPPGRPKIIQYDPDEPSSRFRTNLPPHHPRYLRQPAHRMNPLLQLLQFLLFLPVIIFALFFYNLGCPDGFRLCPCGIIKRPVHFFARNPHLVFAPLALFCAMYWKELLYQIGSGVWSVVYVGLWSLVLVCAEREARHWYLRNRRV